MTNRTTPVGTVDEELVELCRGHTPGPWCVLSQDDDGTFEVRGPQDELIAEVLGLTADGHLMAAAPTLLTLIEQLSNRVERLETDLHRIDMWADAYPVDIFPEPDLDGVKQVLIANDMLREMDRMHSSWARYLLSSVKEITSAALTPPISRVDEYPTEEME